jgi:hypothetical protein
LLTVMSAGKAVAPGLMLEPKNLLEPKGIRRSFE